MALLRINRKSAILATILAIVLIVSVISFANFSSRTSVWLSVLTGQLNRDFVGLIGWLALFAILAAALLLCLRGAKFVHFTRLSWVVSVVCATGTFGIWAVEYNRPIESFGYGQSITDENSQSEYLQKNVLSSKVHPTVVPTGLFIQSIHFASGNEVDVTGYVWQKYPDGTPKELRRGFVLPEAKDAFHEENLTLREISRVKKKDYELHVWFFTCTLRQGYTYQKFPIDRQNVWLRLWHRDFDKGALLVPDWESYTEPFNPTTLPGLDQEFVREGWTTLYTGFSYQTFKYSSSFGMGKYAESPPHPELYFNVGLKRNVTGPLITRIVPVIVVALLLYAALYLTRRQEKKGEIVGFNIFTVLSYCAALFFVIVIDHATVRSTLAPESLIYLDFFYFVLYILTAFVSLNSILLGVSDDIWIVEYRDNAIPNYLYWPIFFSFIFICTLTTFTR